MSFSDAAALSLVRASVWPRRTIQRATAVVPLEVRATLRAFVLSRVLIWIAGGAAFVLIGTSVDAGGVSQSFGSIGNVLAAPAVRWDALWYLKIAGHGYTVSQEAGFFPLYPLLIRAGSLLVGSAALSGVLISLVALLVALEVIRRLTELELGGRVAEVTVRLIAFGPMALFLSAVYTESLFLALSAGTLYAARRGRWQLAGALGGFAAASRVGGILLFAPVVILFFYGPRADALPARTGSGWRPRYRFAPAALWSLLIPAGAALFAGYLWLSGFGAVGTLSAQQHEFQHQLVMPWVGLWGGAEAAFDQLTLALHGVASLSGQSQGILQLGVLIAGFVGLVAIFSRLPLAYGVYVALDLLMHLSSPTTADPLRGLDRYLSLRFPLFMVLAAWAVERRRERTLLLAFGALLVFFAAQFATWHWVGSTSI